MTGLTPIEFDVQTGFDDGDIKANVLWSQLGPDGWVEPGPPTLEPIYVYANGPSAKDAPRFSPSVALNGAHKLFSEGPDFWIGCDPQEMVSGFVRPAFARTHYLPATKCHRAVYAALSGQRVNKWTVDDVGGSVASKGLKVPTAVSVTICALGLLYAMGYRNVTVFGWDGCYLDGQDHAIPQSHDTSKDVTVVAGDDVFRTTSTWCAEAEDALHYLSMFPDLLVTIPGPGMIGAILRYKGVPNVQ